MPVWLATYLFVVGWIALEWFIGMFVFLMSENDVPCLWYYRYIIAAMVAIPWIWYFMYLGCRYLDKIPRLYYLWLATPFYTVVSRNLDSNILFSRTLLLGEGYIWFISISLWDVAVLCILLFIIHEIYEYRTAKRGGR